MVPVWPMGGCGRGGLGAAELPAFERQRSRRVPASCELSLQAGHLPPWSRCLTGLVPPRNQLRIRQRVLPVEPARVATQHLGVLEFGAPPKLAQPVRFRGAVRTVAA